MPRETSMSRRAAYDQTDRALAER